MACKTCGFGMRHIHAVIRGRNLFWCEECGTVKIEYHKAGIDPNDPDVEWLEPAAWPRAMSVLRRLWRYWRYTEAVGGAGRHESREDILAEPGEMDTQLEPIARSAASVIQDCDPKEDLP